SATVTRQLFGAGSLAYAGALENEALLRMRLGDLLASKGRLDSAVLLYEKVAGKESLPYANSLLTLARYYQLTGDYTKAEPYLKISRDIVRKIKGDTSPEYAGVQNSLALLYQTLGNYRDAEAALKSAMVIYQKTGGSLESEYATVIQNLAALYQLEGALDKAEPLQKEALEIDRKTLGENHPQFAITLQNLATLYQKLGRKAEAKEILEKVLETHARQLGTRHPSYITTLSNLAALYQDLGDFPKAEKTWTQSATLRKEVLGEDHPDYARSLYGLAGVYHAQGQWAKAKTYYDPVVEKYQKQVQEFFPALSEKEKSAFYAKIKPVFDAYQDFAMQYLAAFPEERDATLGKLYDLQLGTKAILLVATNKVRSRILASGNPGLQELFRDWLTTKEQLVRHYSASQEERLRSGVNLTQLESHANELEKKLSEQSDAFRSQREKEKLNWKDVHNALADGEAAVEILRIRRKYIKDSVYYVGLVLQKSSQAPELVRWPYGAQLEGKKFKYHRNTIKYHVNDTISYRYYWAPLESKIKPGTTVFLSCDGVFNKVNFNSLFESNTGHFVIDDYRLHQVSNTRELVGRLSVTKTPKNLAYLFGFADFNLGEADVVSHSSKRNLARSLGFEGESIPVLPATEKEVDGIAEALSRNTWTAENYKRAQASEENLKKADNPKLVHIATHGFFLSDVDLDDTESELNQNPLFRSGVLLAGAGVDREESRREEDGVLTAYEAMNLNLDQTELVVLSACETGLGEVRNGEGVYGLQRSFLVAGANTVLMSLWQVDDVATQELMNAFYRFWLSGTEKHEAFRKAQLQMKEKYQIPYFWGAFVLIGN
ncbi:MAG: CHAT domain-containing protein, partial [Cyclobacteriaceae bacterium]|nr:CHAT domain-containing protein [Cyclobacteriaceae bacterium]